MQRINIWTLCAFLLGSISGCAVDSGSLVPAEISCEPPVELADNCPAPWLPRVDGLHRGATWVFPELSGGTLMVGTSLDPLAEAPDQWVEADRFSIDEPGETRVFARVEGVEGCAPRSVYWTYEGVTAYPPAPEQPMSTALAYDDERIVDWAESVESVVFGAEVDNEFREEHRALGPAEATPMETLVLGEGGQATLTFVEPLVDGPGADFAVFENSVSDGFLELAYVEVSSDGVHFIRFPSAYLGNESLGPFGTHDPEIITGLAGKYRIGFGTPFDLNALWFHPDVVAGTVDLHSITHVRIVDVVGDGTAFDSFGNPIYDPYPTTGSAGFDLDAVGALNTAAYYTCVDTP